MQKHIALINPEILVFVGGVSAKTLLDTNEGISRLRGRWHPYTNPYLKAPIPSYAFFHPAYLLRSPGQKRYVWQDLLRFKKYLETHHA